MVLFVAQESTPPPSPALNVLLFLFLPSIPSLGTYFYPPQSLLRLQSLVYEIKTKQQFTNFYLFFSFIQIWSKDKTIFQIPDTIYIHKFMN